MLPITVSYENDKQIDVAERVVNKVKNKCPSFQIKTDDISEFVNNFPEWRGYKKWYSTNLNNKSSSKFYSYGAYINVEDLIDIHQRNDHGIRGATERTVETVKENYNPNSSEMTPLNIPPLVLVPESFCSINGEGDISYELEKEGRSRAVGYHEAVEEYGISNQIPIMFSVRRTYR